MAHASHISKYSSSLLRYLEEVRSLIETLPHPGSKTQLLKWNTATTNALTNNDVTMASIFLDSSVLLVQRHLGTSISLDQGFEIVDYLLTRIYRDLDIPARTYEVGSRFALRMATIENVCGLEHHRPFPPIDVAGRARTTKAILQTIKSFELPAFQAAQLTKRAQRLLTIKPSNSLSSLRSFETALFEFHGYANSLSPQFLYLHQVNSLMGLIFFAAAGTAATCWIPLTWKAQIVIAVGAIIVGGVVLIYDSFGGWRVHKALKSFISECTHTGQQVDDEVVRLVNDENLNDTEIREVIKNLEEESKALKNNAILTKNEIRRQQQKYSFAIAKLKSLLKNP